MPTYAVVDSTGTVVNVVMWDGTTPWQPPTGTTAVLVPAGSNAGIGSTYSNGTFTPPKSSP
jgi:hypothetical protein